MTNDSRKSYHHGDLANALIVAALEILREKSPNELSLREVAKRAGVSHTAPYRHFSDKSKLLEAIAKIGFERLTQSLKSVAATYANNAQKQLTEAGAAYVRLAVNDPEITQLMFGGFLDSESCSEEIGESSENAFQALLDIIENGKQEGIYLDRDAMDLAMAAWSIVHGLAMLITVGQFHEYADSEEKVRRLSVMVCNLLQVGILKPQ